MANPSNRIAADADLIRLNSVGLSLKTVAGIVGIHPSTVTLRLQSMGVDPADTRRAFMEDVFRRLSPDEQEWLADHLRDSNINVKTFVFRLIQQARVANLSQGTT